MKSRGLITAVLLSTLLLLTGCAVTGQPGTPTGSAIHTGTPSATPSDATVAVDPASYPLPAAALSQGSKGVMFTAGNGGLQCAIFDPLADGTGSPVTVFGCEVSIAGYPYPAIPSGLSDTA